MRIFDRKPRRRFRGPHHGGPEVERPPPRQPFRSTAALKIEHSPPRQYPFLARGPKRNVNILSLSAPFHLSSPPLLLSSTSPHFLSPALSLSLASSAPLPLLSRTLYAKHESLRALKAPPKSMRILFFRSILLLLLVPLLSP